MQPVIENAAPSDAAPLGAILSDWIEETDWMPRLHTRDADRAYVADLIQAGGVRVARFGDTPIGFLFERDCHLGALYLAAEARGQGVGKRLLESLKADCDHIDLWTFEANTGARRFYEREGFRTDERTDGDNAEGLPDLRMIWRREVPHA